MEEDIRKRGMLYLQQQRFGKKWKKVWTILYRESTCSISRLEFFECKDGMSTLEKPNRKQDNKKVIKLSDCIRVSEVDIEGCPRDCGPFLVETTEKLFIFAADNAELEDWTQRLCEIAFPMKRGDRGAGPRRGSLPRVLGDADGVSMENNSLYGERERGMKDFKVCARRSETADKCGLKGYYLMRTDFESLLLKDPRTGEVLYTWPYRFLRRFGRDKMTFSFEAGRRCQSGEGNFEFETKQGNEIFQAVEAAINLQRPTMPRRQTSGGVQEKETPAPPPAVPAEDRRIYSTVDERQVGQAGQSRTGRSPPDGQPCRLDAPAADKVLTGVKSLNIDQRPMPRKSQVKNFRSCPLAKSEDQTYSQITLGSMDHGMERSRSPGSLSADADADYSLPFDAIAKNVMADILQGTRHGGLPAPGDQQQAGEREAAERQRDDRNDDDDDGLDPLYDSIDEMAIGAAALRIRTDSPKTYARAEHIYDEPEGVALGPPADRTGSGRLTQGSGSPSSGGSSATSLYDDPEEVKGQAWRIMGEAGDPSGHEYPYNANADDYAVPKPPRRAFKPPLDRELEENRDNGLSPYDNVNVKKKN